MSPDIEAVIRLQGMDDKAAVLQKEIALLPKQVAEIERQLDAHVRKLDADRAALVSSQKKRKSLEDDNKIWEAKIAKLKDQIAAAKNNEQYKAFQNEIDYAQKGIRQAEDIIIDLMSLGEPLEVAVKTAEVALAEEKKTVGALQEEARNKTAEHQAALQQILEKRQKQAASIPPAVINLYERARKRWKGGGVSDATNRRCESCHIALRPMVFQELRSAERVMTCESCGRILFYNPPVKVEPELQTKA